jgi:alpha,alpha-trehalase
MRSMNANVSYGPVLDHIEGKWDALIRSNPQEVGTLIGLPHRYVVPSDGAMFQEMYYWDSFFTSLGLIDSPRESLVVEMADNFAYLLDRFGLIPNGSRYYFLSRSQPPFFTRQMLLAWQIKERRKDAGRRRWLANMVELAEREHATVWLGTAQPHHRQIHRGLSRYFDVNYLDMLASCESGWDHSNRCDDRWLEHLPVDLNAILAVREADIACAHTILGDVQEAAQWTAARDRRIKTMRSLMWNPATGCFLDYDVAGRETNPTVSAAMFSALWAGVATKAQAKQMVTTWLPKFLKRGGLVTSLKAKAGRQWAYPNGWAPLQWIAVEGLCAYGFDSEATELMRRWCDATASVFAATGQMWEKLNVVRNTEHTEEGFYGAITGFGWSNGVFVDFARRLESR